MKKLMNVFVVFDTRTGERLEYCATESTANKKCKDNEVLDYYEEKVLKEPQNKTGPKRKEM